MRRLALDGDDQGSRFGQVKFPDDESRLYSWMEEAFMSVALLVTRAGDEAGKRLVPVATQESFRSRWLRGATALGLEWVALAETGFDVTSDNRDEVVAELTRLRPWMEAELGAGAYDLERLDRLVDELGAIRFEPGVRVFLG